MEMAISRILPGIYEEVRLSWEIDPVFREICNKLQQGSLKDSAYTWSEGQLRRKGRLVVGNNATLRRKLIHLVHDSAMGGHSGIQASTKRFALLFYWKGLEKDVRQYIRQCDVCQRYKPENTPTPGLLQPLPIPEAIWTQVNMDFITGLPKSYGKDVIFIVVDRLTKYAHFIALQHPYSALTVAQAYMDNVFKLHGLPQEIVSDRDPIFLSNFWQELFKLQGVELQCSSAYHPQTDGQTEVVNRCLENYLRCMTGDRPTEWSKWLPLAEWWYNTNFHTATQISPFEALYGFPPPLHIVYVPGDSDVAAVDQSLQAREAMLKVLKFHLTRAQHRMVQQADKHRQERQFAIGDWVYLKLQPYRQESVQSRPSHKLAAKYFGPFQVIDKVGKVAYKLALLDSSQIHPVIHVSQLKKKVGAEIRVTSQFPVDLPLPVMLEPVAVLGRKMVKQGNRAATKVLVQWSHAYPEDATWEYLYDIQQ
ncbi:hypothetical protein SLEP1_g15252 [Rubroshorea leprosula]|uniref:Integrase catalytic domain-containing protein n=1 Tax=Rubroshorea leprosula TaxID=152421 RepID=A0AAV5ISN1_9ROSI|nr:hypothetical protein SLEP1_g15252 [Rubroshorea leprosula]